MKGEGMAAAPYKSSRKLCPEPYTDASNPDVWS